MTGDVKGALVSLRDAKKTLEDLLATDPANLTVLLDAGNVDRRLGTALAMNLDRAN